MIEPITTLVLGVASAVTVAVLAARRRRARLRSWSEATRRMGLGEVHLTPRRWPRGAVLTGRWQELDVRLESYRRGKSESGTRIVISGLGHGPEGLSISREGLGTRLFGRDVETGDPAFDREVYVEGPPLLARALLNAATRERIEVLLGGCVHVPGPRPEIPVDVRLDNSVLEVRLRERSVDATGETLFQVLKSALAAAQRLVAPPDLPRRLADNLQHEPEAGVRLQTLLMLARELPGHPETGRALRTRLQDRSDEVRLRAAQALGEEGQKTLRDLLGNATTEDGCAARALVALGDQMPSGRIRNLLERTLASGRQETARACLDLLSRRGHAGAQQLYLQALAAEDMETAAAAARALGRAGTVEAVAPLREQASSLLPTALRAAARQAIAEIQSRLTGAEPGQLTLAGGEAGALSLARESGGLSLAQPEPEQLSLGWEKAGKAPE